jgi:hypothetical protein
MADHGEVEYALATGNDLPAHVQTYDSFVHLATIGVCLVVSIVIGLAVGTVLDQVLAMVFIFVAALIAAVHGLATGARVPSAVMVVISLLILAFCAT